MLSLGIDIGGSGFRMGVFDLESGDLVGSLKSVEYITSPHPDAVLPMMLDELEEKGWNGPIGIGFPGVVANNAVRTAPNLGDAWIGVDIQQTLRAYHNGQFHMLNDADAVAVGEQRFGHGHEGHTCVLTLTIGTGLGTTVHQHEHWYRISNSAKTRILPAKACSRRIFREGPANEEVGPWRLGANGFKKVSTILSSEFNLR